MKIPFPTRSLMPERWLVGGLVSDFDSYRNVPIGNKSKAAPRPSQIRIPNNFYYPYFVIQQNPSTMNRYLLLPILLLLSLKISAQALPEASVVFPGKHCLNETEQKMAIALNQYRASLGLKPIPVSASLSWVARVHVGDLKENYVYGSSCNMHSWSQNDAWSSCCYKSDHKMAQCMWDKPRELSNYKGDGYEIAFYSTYDYPDADSFVTEALNGWKTSRGHHDIIANRGKWTTAKFEAMGVGANDEFIVVWFGEMTDLAGPPENCR